MILNIENEINKELLAMNKRDKIKNELYSEMMLLRFSQGTQG